MVVDGPGRRAWVARSRRRLHLLRGHVAVKTRALAAGRSIEIVLVERGLEEEIHAELKFGVTIAIVLDVVAAQAEVLRAALEEGCGVGIVEVACKRILDRSEVGRAGDEVVLEVGLGRIAVPRRT